jgi:hypothetical protein
MQITCIKVEKGSLPVDERWQSLKADFLLNDTGIVLRDCQCVWDTETGGCVVSTPDNIGFFNVFFQTAFAAMAVQAALLLLAQQNPTPAALDGVKALWPSSGLVQ